MCVYSKHLSKVCTLCVAAKNGASAGNAGLLLAVEIEAPYLFSLDPAYKLHLTRPLSVLNGHSCLSP